MEILINTGIFVSCSYEELVSLEKLSINDVILSKRNYSFTALHLACLRGKLDVVRRLLEYGCHINQKSLFFCWNALFFAISFVIQSKQNKNVSNVALGLDIANLLIEKGVDLEVEDKNGDTPITYATKFGIKYEVD